MLQEKKSKTTQGKTHIKRKRLRMDTLTSDYKKSLKNPYIEENQTTQ